jgi:hypothetical protein
MKWVALLLAVVAGLGFAADRAFSPADPIGDCSGAFTPGGLVEESDPGAATADAAVAGFLERAETLDVGGISDRRRRLHDVRRRRPAPRRRRGRAPGAEGLVRRPDHHLRLTHSLTLPPLRHTDPHR